MYILVNFFLNLNRYISHKNGTYVTGIGISTGIKWTECQAFSPVVRIGFPAPSQASECGPPLVPGGRDTLACGRGGGAKSGDGTGNLVL
jgi:hypothetical protein